MTLSKLSQAQVMILSCTIYLKYYVIKKYLKKFKYVKTKN